MKQGWEIKKLSEICISSNGLWKGKKPPFSTIAVLRSTNFTKDCKLKLDDVALIEVEDKSFAKRRLQKNDIVVERSGGGPNQPVGRVLLFNIDEDDYSFCNFTSLLRVNDATYISPIFLHKYLTYFYLSGQTIEMQSNTIGLRNLDFTKYLDIDIPIPPISEQEHIVQELDLLSSVIEKQKLQLKELDNLSQSIFYDMFGDPITNEKGWEVKKVKDIFNVKIGPFGSLLHNSDYISGGTPLVNPIHMQDEKICPDFNFSVSDEKLKELDSYLLQPNDIVFARRGDIGRCVIVGKDENGYLCGTGSLFIRPTQPTSPVFMLKSFRCKSMIEHLTSLAKGATMLNINCKIIEELNIIMPPLYLQQEFASKIEAIEKQTEILKQSIEEAETLFNSRMDYYFN